MTKSQEIGHEHLEFWGACIRERESGDGVYATWTSIRTYSAEQIGAEVMRTKRPRPNEPPSGLLRFVQVEIALQAFEGTSVRELLTHVYVKDLPMSRYFDDAVVRAMSA